MVSSTIANEPMISVGSGGPSSADTVVVASRRTSPITMARPDPHRKIE